MTKYIYQSEKLASARRMLMLPHSEGEASAIANCFLECSLAFNQLDESKLDDDARKWVVQIKKFMDTKDVPGASGGEGRWHVKALGFTTDDKIELSTAVDELAFWFGSYDQ